MNAGQAAEVQSMGICVRSGIRLSNYSGGSFTPGNDWRQELCLSSKKVTNLPAYPGKNGFSGFNEI